MRYPLHSNHNSASYLYLLYYCIFIIWNSLSQTCSLLTQSLYQYIMDAWAPSPIARYLHFSFFVSIFSLLWPINSVKYRVVRVKSKQLLCLNELNWYLDDFVIYMHRSALYYTGFSNNWISIIFLFCLLPSLYSNREERQRCSRSILLKFETLFSSREVRDDY